MFSAAYADVIRFHNSISLYFISTHASRQNFGVARVDLEKALALDPRHESAVKCLDTMEKMIERENVAG